MARSRSGVGARELVACLLLVAMVVIPAGYLAFVSRRPRPPTAMTLLAWHAAREEIEDARMLVRSSSADPRRISHDLRAFDGPILSRLSPLLPPDSFREAALCYPHQVGRIFTRLQVDAASDPRFFPAVLEVRWEESPAAGGGEGMERIPFLLIRSRGVQP